MNDNLSNALAELASGLGTSTTELWNYLQGQGLHDYAMATIAVDAAKCSAFLIATIACAVIVAKNYKNAIDFGDDGSFLLVLVSWITGIICAMFFAVTVTDLVGWVASPEGMVIKMLIDSIA